MSRCEDFRASEITDKSQNVAVTTLPGGYWVSTVIVPPWVSGIDLLKYGRTYTGTAETKVFFGDQTETESYTARCEKEFALEQHDRVVRDWHP